LSDQTLHGRSKHSRKEEPMLRKLFHDEKGQDMIEYALLGSFISIVAIVVIRAIGPLVTAIYTNIQSALTP
jgi:Flp pilus assembly pilin Flp